MKVRNEAPGRQRGVEDAAVFDPFGEWVNAREGPPYLVADHTRVSDAPLDARLSFEARTGSV